MSDKPLISKIKFLLVMSCFGCLGPLVLAIGLPSSVTACLRAWISALFLLGFIIVTRHKTDIDALKKLFLPLSASGALIALDWIGLFSSYRYTSVATATVCYYIAPVMIFIASPFLLREKVKPRHVICAAAAFAGMVMVSGVLDESSSNGIKGPLFAILGAAAYAGVILINKKYPSSDSLVRTTIQLIVAAIITTPYIILTTDLTSLSITARGVILLFVLSVGLTAVTYILYFRLILDIPAKSVAILSYADPVVAVFISVIFMNDPLSLPEAAGAVLIIGSAIVSELI